MKHKKILTVTLIMTIIAALSILTSLQSNIPTELQASATAPAPEAIPLTPGQPIPTAPGLNYPKEKILDSLAPNPEGCILDQDTVENILNNFNECLNSALRIADVLNQQPLNRQAPNDKLKTVIINKIMPQDTTKNCKVLRDYMEYLRQLMRAVEESLFYAVPSNAATRAI